MPILCWFLWSDCQIIGDFVVDRQRVLILVVNLILVVKQALPGNIRRHLRHGIDLRAASGNTVLVGLERRPLRGRLRTVEHPEREADYDCWSYYRRRLYHLARSSI